MAGYTNQLAVEFFSTDEGWRTSTGKDWGKLRIRGIQFQTDTDQPHQPRSVYDIFEYEATEKGFVGFLKHVDDELDAANDGTFTEVWITLDDADHTAFRIEPVKRGETRLALRALLRHALKMHRTYHQTKEQAKEPTE